MNHELIAHLVSESSRVVIVQAANPDGDSLGSALGLEAILGDMGKSTQLHCPSEMPIHLHYISGWDRVVQDFDSSADLAIIVDTSSETLLSKTLEIPGTRHFFESHPPILIDHHSVTERPTFETVDCCDADAVSTTQVITELAIGLKWPIPSDGAEALLAGILSDSLGLTTPATSIRAHQAVIHLMEAGAHASSIEEKRREYMKKSPKILTYEGELLQRIEYDLDGQLAVIHIPWEDIEQYSGEYNPSILVLDEMRFVSGVNVAIALKTYPDGRITGKVKGNLPIANTIAGYFGGGGHPYMAGFRVYEEYDTIRHELISAYTKAMEHNNEII